MSTRRVDSSGVHSSTTLAENKISALRDRAALPPSFTPHEEEAEWGSVTPAEMLEIESDLRGLSVDGSAPSSKSSSPGMYDDGVLGGVGGVVGDFGSLLAGPQGTESGPQISTSLTEEERETAMLPALEAEIAAIPPSEKDVYVKATRKCPDLVDDEHKKAFLFKEGFDAKVRVGRNRSLEEPKCHRENNTGVRKCFNTFGRYVLLQGWQDDDSGYCAEVLIY